MNMVLCDTDVMIEYLKGNEQTKETLNDIGAENIALSSITIMELYFGVLNKRELGKIKETVEKLEILHINESISKKAVELIEEYSKSYRLKIPDALIGATSLCHRIELFTYNIKDFRFIEGLKLYRKLLKD